MTFPTPPPIVSGPLQMPVSLTCARVEAFPVEDSLRLAAQTFCEVGIGALPVVQGQRFVGLITEAGLSRALAEGRSPDDSVESILESTVIALPPHATGAEALRAFETNRQSAAVVVDADGVPLGILTPARLYEQNHRPNRPRLVGGMATPYGVYLTNGVVAGGVGPLALVVTGMLMFGIFAAGMFLILGAATVIDPRLILSAEFANVMQFGVLVLFMLTLRLLPLSGTHAAEHMVVHAIERGEELTPEIVARMPRVHPRCGTNLAVGAMLFLGLFTWEWTPNVELRLIVAAVATLMLWRPLGSLMQYYVTTKRPTRAQIDRGIHAGKQLLARAAVAPYSQASVGRRLANSGLFQIMLGALIVQGILWLIVSLAPLPAAWRGVFF